MIRKAIDSRSLDREVAHNLLETFREEAGRHSPCYAYNNLEGDLQGIVANDMAK